MLWSFLVSLRFRLLLLVFLTALPALGLLIYTLSEQRRAAAAEASAEVFQLARLVSAEQERLLANSRQLLVALAHIPAVRAGDPAVCSVRLAEVLRQAPLYANLATAELDGYIYCSAVPSSAPAWVADRLYYQRALTTRDFAVGDLVIGRISRKPTLTVAYPILDEAGQVQKMALTGLGLDWVGQLAAAAHLPSGAAVTVLDRSGTVLTRWPDPEQWVGRTEPEAPLLRTIVTQGEGTTEAVGVDGVRRLYAFSPLASAPGGRDAFVAVGVPTDVVFAAAHRIFVRNLTWFGLVSVLMLLSTWVGGDVFILRQVRALVRATHRLGAGDRRARTRVTRVPPGVEELNQLARAFNDMAASLERQHEQLLLDEKLRFEKAEMEAEMARAGEIQAQLLPGRVPVLPGFDLSGGCLPARTVGGDFYDWQEPTPGILTLALGDVMGKGIAAALLMATVRASLRAVSAHNPPARALELAEQALDVDFEASESFVTVFLGRLDVARRRFTYADAGHGLVFVRRREGPVEGLEPRGLPLGVRFGESYEEGVLTFRAGDTLVLYSDGLIDARPELGLDPEALAAVIADAPSAQVMVHRLFALAAPRAHLPDDLTVVVLRCTEG